MVLGKRTRSSADTALSSQRVSKQARTEVFDEAENDNPFITRNSRSRLRNVEPTIPTQTRILPPKAPRLFKQPTSSISEVADSNINDENLSPTQIPTPQTPRHRDALSKKNPITPRHRVLVASKPFTPQTPRTPVTPGGIISTVYGKARQVFARSNEPGKLVGREVEKEELTTFIKGHIDGASGGCIYVSGPPGTGKSAMVNEVTSNLDNSADVQKAYINCMSIKTTKDLYGSLIDELCEGIEVLEGQEVSTLQSMFMPRKKSKTSYVVTLDEIDHILTLDLEILYKLFEWSLQKSSRLVLLGIANALDLTDRFLPRLKARNLKPQLLPFLPYTAAQIKTVITTRLKSLMPSDSLSPDYVPFMHPGAIELCSRKVSSQTGDLRKAFDICRRAIDMIEAETKFKHEQALILETDPNTPSKRPLEEISNDASPTSKKSAPPKSLAQSLSTLTIETAPRALIMHVNKITSSTMSNGATSRLKGLNLQQKAALCALIALEKSKRDSVANLITSTPSKSRIEAPTIKALYNVYSTLCKRDSILHPLTNTEFRDVIDSLETLSLVCGVDSKSGNFIGLGGGRQSKKFGSGVGSGDEKRVGSCVGEKEVAQAVEGLGAGILKTILSGTDLD